MATEAIDEQGTSYTPGACMRLASILFRAWVLRHVKVVVDAPLAGAARWWTVASVASAGDAASSQQTLLQGDAANAVADDLGEESSSEECLSLTADEGEGQQQTRSSAKSKISS